MAADDWTVHDARSARRRQIARAYVIDGLLPDASARDSSSAVGIDGDSAGVPWQDGALEFLVRIEGLVRAIERIRIHYFKNHEIVYGDLADTVDGYRNGIHSVLTSLEEQNGGNESWIVRLSDPGIPDEGERADPEYAERERRVQERVAHAARNTTRELVHRAHFTALDFVGERRDAKAVIDKELKAMFG